MKYPRFIRVPPLGLQVKVTLRRPVYCVARNGCRRQGYDYATGGESGRPQNGLGAVTKCELKNFAKVGKGRQGSYLETACLELYPSSYESDVVRPHFLKLYPVSCRRSVGV